MEIIPNKIIVFGGNHHNTLGVIRSLGEAGITPILILHGTNHSFVAQSKYISQTYYVSNEEEGVKFLIEKYTKENFKPIIICCSDGASSCIDKNYNNLSPHFIFPNAEEEGRITLLMNKEKMRLLAEKYNLKTPQTWIISKRNPIPNNLHYPCIIKPLLSIEGSKTDIHICYNSSDLNQIIKVVHAPIIQVQEYIDKDYEFQFIGCRIKNKNEEHIIIPGVSQIIRSSSVSNTGFLKFRPINSQENIEIAKVKEFIRATKYIGLFSVEFIKSKHGDNYFMEINFRNDGNAYALTGAGYNLPYIWCKGMTDNSIEEKKYVAKKETLVIPELIDFFQSVLTHKISFIHWIKDVIKSHTYLLYNKKDSKPFYDELKYYMQRALNKVKRNSLDVSWNIGFVDINQDFLDKSTWDIHWMKHNYKNRWFADPFILKVTNDDIIVLVEEFYDPIHRGRISKLTIDKQTYELKKIDVILELNSHLSFPAIFRKDDKIYIYPENSAEGHIVVYEFDEKSNNLKPHKILHNEPLTDASLETCFNSFHLFTTKLPVQNGNQLFIYQSEKWDGEYHLIQTMEFPSNTGRNAGSLFRLNGKIIRPAQDCNGAYGKGLVFYEISYTEGTFEMKELKRIYPQHTIYDQGMHTFNVYNNLAVIDGRKFRKPFISKSLLAINKFIKKIK